MAKRYENLSGGTIWAGSIEDSFKETTELDTSLVKPIFKRDQFKNA